MFNPQACGGMRGYDCLGGICCVARVCYPMGVGGGGAGRNLWKGMQWPKELCKKLFKGPEGQIGGGGGAQTLLDPCGEARCSRTSVRLPVFWWAKANGHSA
jgi:hypothetical protein